MARIADLHKKWLKEPKYRKAYGAIEEKFVLASAVVDVRTDPEATPIHGYRRRIEEGGSHPRPGTVYGLPPWRRSPPPA